MSPRLVALAGPCEGSTFPIPAEGLTIGRKSTNQLPISDLALSRHHCVVKEEAGQFKIVDLDSDNGTLVNGAPVKERFLAHGDRLRIGGSLFVFLLEEGETAGAVLLPDSDLEFQNTVVLRDEDALYLRAEEPPAACAPGSRVERDLKSLLRISAALGSATRLEELEHKLLESLFEVIPAQRGAILLGQEAGNLASIFACHRAQGRIRNPSISRTVVRRVLQEKAGILCNETTREGAFAAAQSVIGSRLTALLAAPLMLCRNPLGLIYLDTAEPGATFDSGHLQLLAAAGVMAAGTVENVRLLERLESENRCLREATVAGHNMVGESAEIRRVCELISRVAPLDSTVLITGETGTGKELVARAIHRSSPRSAKPFVAINCAALTETLLESELFGHEKGAFTGAAAQKKGRIELAEGGTLFLDEIGELAPSLQAKLLRVLEEREFQRVGGTHTIKLNIRLLASTNRDLAKAVQDGTFRPDLLFRLKVISIEVPPLRARPEDIPLLADYFLEKFGSRFNRRIARVTPEAQACLLHYDWPGNVRELENAIESAVALGSTELILPDDLPDAVLAGGLPASAPLPKYYQAIAHTKRRLIEHSFEQANGDYTEAAKLLGLHPNSLLRLVRSLNLKAAHKKRPTKA